ncbi:MAG: hypothetical protein HW403_1171, partial [Dehalococcoidia bacterium]|nr:hypothetical protein [Dehalococcoidia bacterium]
MNTTPAISPIRLIVWSLFLSGATVALILRLGYLQVINYQEYRERAVEEHSSRQTVMAPRGSIKDRNGHPLALTV